MATNSIPVDENRLKDVFNEIRSDQGEPYRKAWLAVGHVQQNPQSIDIIEMKSNSSSPFEELSAVLTTDQVIYCLLRLTTTFDMSNTVKFVYIHWIGENVPFAKKGRFGVVSGSVKNFFRPFHLLVETSSLEDLTEENIIKKLEETSGVRNKVIEGSVEGRQERGFTAHSVKSQKNKELRSVAPAGMEVKISDELLEAIKEVRKDDIQTKWVLAGFQDGDIKKSLQVINKSEGNLEELKSGLQDDLVQFALYRTSDEYDSIKTVKFVYIYWIGEQVKPMTKGKLSALAGPIEKIFSPAHVTMMFSNKQEIQEHVIKDKVQASSGSKISIK